MVEQNKLMTNQIVKSTTTSTACDFSPHFPRHRAQWPPVPVTLWQPPIQLQCMGKSLYDGGVMLQRSVKVLLVLFVAVGMHASIVRCEASCHTQVVAHDSCCHPPAVDQQGCHQLRRCQCDHHGVASPVVTAGRGEDPASLGSLAPVSMVALAGRTGAAHVPARRHGSAPPEVALYLHKQALLI